MKNVVITDINSREIKWLSGTMEGKKHDKKICDEEAVQFPSGSHVFRDSGFQGHGVEDVVVYEPKKKPKGNELTTEEKENNKSISSVRVAVEHAIEGIKILRITKDIFRNTKDLYDDVVIELASGLHNFRSFCRV